MPTPLALTQTFPVPPSQVHALLRDRDRVAEFARAVNGPTATVRTHQETNGRLTIVTESPVPTEGLPAPLRTMLASRAVGTKTEVWTESGDGYSATFDIAVSGAPAKLTATATLTPAPGGSRLSIDGTVDVNVPVLGPKIEKLLVDQATQRLTAEYAFVHTLVA